jgi:FtsH-binding integral membrane protein
MKNIRKPIGRDKKGKMAIVAALFTGAVLITGSGAWFAVYSVMNNISLKVMNSSIPGIVFALLVMYFGIRFFISVRKLSKEILKDSSYFSWSNFKKAKPAKSR